MADKPEGFKVRTSKRKLSLMVTTEYLSELKDIENRVTKLNIMRQADSQVGGLLKVLKLPIRQATWDIDEEKGKPEHREFIRKNLFLELKTSFSDFIRLALTMLDFGFSVFDKVFQYDETDRKLKWSKLQYLPQLNTKEIKTESDGGLKHLIQNVPEDEALNANASEPKVPVDYLLVFANEREGDWYGTSILRNAYGNFKIKDILLRIDAIKHDRFGVGTPTAKLKTGYKDSDVAILEKYLPRIRSHEHGYLILPPGMEEISMLDVGKATNVLSSINYHDEAMSKSILAQFLDLGTSKSGNRALGQSFIELFLMSLNAITGNICETFNKYAVKQLVDLNWGEQDEYPELMCQNIDLSSIYDIVESVERLTTSGFIKPEPTDNNYFRGRFGMDPAEEVVEETAVQETEMIVGHKYKDSACGHEFIYSEPEKGKYWRELFPTEVKHLNVRKMTDDIEDMKKTFTQEMIKIRDKQIKSIVYQMVNQGKEYHKITARYSDLYEKTLTDYMEKAFYYGSKTVTEEKKGQFIEQGIEKVVLYEIENLPEDILAFIGFKSKVGSETITSRTKTQLADLYMALKEQGLSSREIAARIYNETLGKGEKVFAHEFFKVENIFREGRAKTAERDEQIQGGFYSAIMDRNVCFVCLEADQQYNAGHDEPFKLTEMPPAPNPECQGILGGNACRCVHVYEWFRETGD